MPKKVKNTLTHLPITATVHYAEHTNESGHVVGYSFFITPGQWEDMKQVFGVGLLKTGRADRVVFVPTNVWPKPDSTIYPKEETNGQEPTKQGA